MGPSPAVHRAAMAGAKGRWADTIGAADPPTMSERSEDIEPRQSPWGQARRAVGAKPPNCWGGRVGGEPTPEPCGPHNGFVDRERHRAPNPPIRFGGFAPTALRASPHGLCRGSASSLRSASRGRIGCADCVRPPPLGARPFAARRGPVAPTGFIGARLARCARQAVGGSAAPIVSAYRPSAPAPSLRDGAPRVAWGHRAASVRNAPAGAPPKATPNAAASASSASVAPAVRAACSCATRQGAQRCAIDKA